MFGQRGWRGGVRRARTGLAAGRLPARLPALVLGASLAGFGPGLTEAAARDPAMHCVETPGTFLCTLGVEGPLPGSREGEGADGGSTPDPPPDVRSEGACHPEEPSYRSVVKSRRRARLASETVVDAEEIAAAPRTRSADDLLRLVPGVWVSQHGAEGKGQQIFLRGFDAAHGTDVAVSVDGIPVNEPSNIHGHGYVDLGFVIPELVRRVVAHKGPFFLDDSNFATAGAVNLELGVPDSLRGSRVHYQLGSSWRHRGLVLHAPKEGALKRSFLAFEAMRDRGFAPGRDAQRAAMMGQIELYRSPEVGVIDLTLSGHSGSFGAPGAIRTGDVESGLLDREAALHEDTGGRSSRGLIALRHRRRDVGTLEHQLYAQARDFEITEDFTGYLLDPVHGDRRLQEHTSFSGGYRLSYTRPIAERLMLVSGGRWRGELIDQREVQVDAEHQELTTRWDLGIAQHHLGAHSGLRWAPLPGLVMEGGGRLDLFTYWVVDNQQDVVPGEPTRTTETLVWPSPRLNLRYAFTPLWTVSSAYGRGVRAPEARSILGRGAAAPDTDASTFQGGDPRTTASDSVEAGVRFAPRWMSAGLTLFGTWVDRELVYDHVSGLNLARNRSRRLGGEASLRIQPAPWVVFGGDLTAVDARFVDSGEPIPYAPPLLGSANLTMLHPAGITVGARVWALGRRPLPFGARSSATALVDLKVSYRVSRLQVDLILDNLLNARWSEGEYNFASWHDRSRARSSLPARHMIAGAPLTARLGVTLWL